MTALSQRIALYSSMFRNWGNLVSGHSYWHIPQGAGTEFVPGGLTGYFNDLTGKTHWRGETDDHGVPLVRIGGQLQRFPTTILQKALGHWDLWLSSNRIESSHYKSCLELADWALSSQDERGGWAVPSLDTELLSPYSAMVQGQAISLLSRLYSVTGRRSYIEAAEKAASVMLTPMADLGTARFEASGIILEEYPLARPHTVLNGWIFALYGLYDLELVNQNPESGRALQSTLKALVSHLPDYDAGYWSLYDSEGTIASPFYHRLHIAQLRTLQATFSQHAEPIGEVADRFECYSESTFSQLRAAVAKTCQKLHRPPKTIVN